MGDRADIEQAPLDIEAIRARIAVPPGADREWRFAATAALQLCAEVERLRAHRCQLPSSIIEALNSGDGTYRP